MARVVDQFMILDLSVENLGALVGTHTRRTVVSNFNNCLSLSWRHVSRSFRDGWKRKKISQLGLNFGKKRLELKLGFSVTHLEFIMTIDSIFRLRQSKINLKLPIIYHPNHHCACTFFTVGSTNMQTGYKLLYRSVTFITQANHTSQIHVLPMEH